MTVVAFAAAPITCAHERSRMIRMPSHVSALALCPADTHRPDSPRATTPLFVAQARAAAILSHRITEAGEIIFSLQSKCLTVGEPTEELANWLEDELTMPGLIVTYGLYGEVMPMLQSMIRPGQHYSLSGLLAAPRSRFEDLSRPPQSDTPEPFETVCTAENIENFRADPLCRGGVFVSSPTDRIDLITRERAVTTWRLWLRNHALATGDHSLCDHVSACLDAELHHHSLQTADALGRPNPTF